MKLIVLFFIFLSSVAISADPLKITAIFLSDPTKSVSSLMPQGLVLYGELSARDEKCVKMGEHCFHPQFGIVEEGKEKEVKGIASPDVEFNHMNLDDVDELQCSKGSFFDFYCGKAKEIKKEKTPLEVWIDTSSSMRRVDFSKDDRYCERRRAVSLLKSSCKGGLDIHGFDTGKRQIIDEDIFCRNVGMNDGGRLVRWMKASDAKHLVIVTDVDEFNGEFRDYLEGVSADIRGIGQKPVVAVELPELLKSLSTSCRK